MAIKLPSNLHRNRFGIFYFRLSIPKDLHCFFHTQTIYRSLRTSDQKKALAIVHVHAYMTKQLFGELRREKLDEKRKTLISAWNEFIALPDLRLRLKVAGMQIALDEQETELNQKENFIINKELEHQQHKEWMQTHHTPSTAISNDARSSEPKEESHLKNEINILSNHSLSTYIEPYIKSINDNREPSDWINTQGLDDHRRTCKILVEIIGDKPIEQFTIVDRNHFDDVIKRYPVNREKISATRGKSLEDILNLPNYGRINLKTAKFHASRANAFLHWVARQVGTKCPFTLLEGVRIKKGKGAEKKRREFNESELTVLFSPSTYPVQGPHEKLSPYKFWIPLIGLLTGARLNEIAQLRVSDVIVKEDVYCFQISEEDDESSENNEKYLAKSVKTHAATRIVPIHSKLIELGFLEYFATTKRLGCTLLFEDLAHAKTKYGALVSKWFAAHCDRIGLTDKALTFHSFRHGVIGHLRRKRVPKDIRMVLVGHSAAEDTHDEYGDIQGDITLLRKKEAIESICFDHVLDYAQLKRKAPTSQHLA